MLLLSLLACGPTTPDSPQLDPEPGPTREVAPAFEPSADAVPEGSHTVLLARHPERLEVVQLVGHTRPGPPPAEELQLELSPDKTPGGEKRGVRTWLARIQLRTPEQGPPWRHSPVGMEIWLGERRLKYVRGHQDDGTVWTWTTHPKGLRVHLPKTHEEPVVRVLPGSIRKDALSLDRRTFEGSDTAFIARTQPLYQAWRTGLYLPPPATVRFEHTLPEGNPVFTTRVHLPSPPYGKTESDGATLEVFVLAGGERHEVARTSLRTGKLRPIRADLSRWAGQTITLELKTDGGATVTHDHVFLQEPAIFTPTDHPRRVLLIVVDTLRADHMGMYGYRRNTSAVLDEWVKGGVVMEGARSAAPWTLPSSRAILTGRQPEAWTEGLRLNEALAKEGFTSVSLVSNIYLGSAYGLHDGWSFHRRQPQNSRVAVQGAMDILESPEFNDRDLFLFLHIMDPHAPYAEREEFRSIWASPPPDDLPERPQSKPIRQAFERARRKGDDALADTIRTWTVDRYDQNIVQVDNDVEKLLNAIGPEAWVVFTSDHGERFFTGPGETYEHGQGLEDDLVHVPLLFRGPGIEPARFAATTSVLDIAPTLIERFAPNDDTTPTDGRSLVSALTTSSELEDAPAGFGRLLYGESGWGVVEGDHRYTSRGDDERVVTLDDTLLGTPDPKADREVWRRKLYQAIDRMPVPAWRVTMPGESSRIAHRGIYWTATRPGGFPDAWGATDTISRYSPLLHEGDTLTVRRHAGGPASREVYIPITDTHPDLEGTHITFHHKGKVYEKTLGPAPSTGEYPRLGPKKIALTVDRVWMPRTIDEGDDISDELASELEALGYLEGNDE